MANPNEDYREWKRTGKKKLRTEKELLALARSELRKAKICVPVRVTRRLPNPKSDATLLYDEANGGKLKRGSASIRIHPVHKYTPASQARSVVRHEANHYKDLLKGTRKRRGKYCSG